MPDLTLTELVQTLRASRAWQRKQDIQQLSAGLLPFAPLVGGEPVLLGDDAAAIPLKSVGGGSPDGYLLLAAEVIWPPLVQADPYLAGRNAVLTNVNDIYAMGGRPVALVNTILAETGEAAAAIARGLRDGCERYGLPLLGGHLTAAGDFSSVAAFILGRATHLLTSFDARPGDDLLLATRLQGRFHPQFPFWDCAWPLEASVLRADLDLLPQLAERGLCDAARDVSMGGILGSALMLLEPSHVGAVIQLDRIPRPAAADGRLTDWLMAFPGYGFVLSARPHHTPEVCRTFTARGLACEVIGAVTAERRVLLRADGAEVCLWDFAAEPFIGFTASQSLEGRR